VKEYGVFKGKDLIEKCENEIVGKETALKLTSETGENYFWRKLRFDELTEEDKFFRLKSRLDELKEFLNKVNGSGRTYKSNTSINADELEWLLKMAEEKLQIID
jgi:hypothetical protein